MLVLMLSSRMCCDNGFDVRYLKEGQTYEVADTAARYLISNNWAKEVRHA